MDDMGKAILLLEECENGLRKLVSAAVERGDYGSVMRLTAWAKVVGHLPDDDRAQRNSSSEPREERSHSSGSTPRATTKTSTTKPSKGSGARVGRPPKGRDYPKFFRTSRELIKIGWSKRERAEYEHKAPYEVLLQLVSKLNIAAADGAIFTADMVFPLEAEDGSAVPNYQSYLCLAWLRHEELVIAHGRQGYTLAQDNLSDAVDSKWKTLEPWRR